MISFSATIKQKKQNHKEKTNDGNSNQNSAPFHHEIKLQLNNDEITPIPVYALY